jgi:nitrate/TMAO reductase-like tetraheme cytochrome c subunit
MKLPRSIYSWTTVAGAALAFISFLTIVFLMSVSLIFDHGDSYSGLITYIILPVFLVIGLLMIPLGAIQKLRKNRGKMDETVPKLPIVNLNDPAQRTALFIFILGSTVFLLLSSVGSYEAFHYTESNEFCGTLCHSVMEPEYVTYHGSAHARVNCVECHVGSGADWYVRSKLSGLYQVYSVLTNSFPTPIETPVHSLRPARETCEKCHWPEKFYDRKYITNRHYLANEENSEWDISLLMKTGPRISAQGLHEGIHWHINPEVKMEYLPLSRKRDSIGLVIYTNLKTGKVTTYRDGDVDSQVPENYTDQLREMDCLDCHNRPSHNYKSPSTFFDMAMRTGKISSTLPNIKLTSMGILQTEYSTKDSAMAGIKQKVLEYYEENYPEVFSTDGEKINQAIAALQEGYSNNIFPFMKAQWTQYPNYIGHIESNGCFRCHNNSFTSEEGRVITNDCDLCHDIKAQGPPNNLMYATGDSSLVFNHPEDIGDEWMVTKCFECHEALY